MVDIGNKISFYFSVDVGARRIVREDVGWIVGCECYCQCATMQKKGLKKKAKTRKIGGRKEEERLKKEGGKEGERSKKGGRNDEERNKKGGRKDEEK
jgi:hypothetical protein